MIKNTKYNSNWVIFNGVKFQSKDEMLFYILLLHQKKTGLIKDFTLQPKFVLIEKFTYFGIKRREVTYTPDFRIEHIDGTIECVDVKGYGTQQGDLRRKIFEWKYPDVKLTWISRNLKHGNRDGWIEYDELKKILRKKGKEKNERL